MSGLVLYAIVDSVRAPLASGILRTKLAVVPAGGARVVVERGEPPEPSAEMIRAYDRVVRRIARAAGAILPFRFGSTASSTEALARMLERAEEPIARALARVRGCVQYTHRLYGPPARARRRASGGPGTRWLSARLAARSAPEMEPVSRAVEARVRATRVDRHEGRAPLLASVYHLVPRAEARAYLATVKRVSGELDPSIRLETRGPFPPYAFAELDG